MFPWFNRCYGSCSIIYTHPGVTPRVDWALLCVPAALGHRAHLLKALCFCYNSNGCSLHWSSHAQPGIGSVQRVACKAAPPWWMAVCLPTLFPAFLHKSVVPGIRPFKCLLPRLVLTLYRSCLVFSGILKMPHQNDVTAMCIGNLSRVPRSTING